MRAREARPGRGGRSPAGRDRLHLAAGHRRQGLRERRRRDPSDPRRRPGRPGGAVRARTSTAGRCRSRRCSGKPTVVTVWGSWCADCHKESPYVVAAAKELGATAHFVGIDSRDPGTAQAKAFQSQLRHHLAARSTHPAARPALLPRRDHAQLRPVAPWCSTPRAAPPPRSTAPCRRPATLVEMVRQVAQGG